ncbi:DUF3016 domain-containing protein [Janthinobacterium agaricidamnosum]|uniref:DUF3016 domain-containing protein n=1 Tax=Janthinobacterium agaricidamnosum NBRC 102515 = DSM 9628 TaxID=1349767 RepID=W0V957_9BURK|nr:DUF3016 domain-containing protein [Janthinobacterium agaricidamnosum]CDG85364.1 putative uncharacterized protein [Janthinobacterium agaricidamnosum NBRC 102515 = DSM 9628]
MKPFSKTLLVSLSLLASSAAWAGVTVDFVKPEQFSDMPFNQSEKEAVLDKVGKHLELLGKNLPAGQNLKVEVLDIDLAGRLQPSRRALDDIRIMNGGADWPRMHVTYELEADGKVISSGDAQLSDLSYLNRINRYPSGESLRYEKQMLDDWFNKTFKPQTSSK